MGQGGRQRDRDRDREIVTEIKINTETEVEREREREISLKICQQKIPNWKANKKRMKESFKRTRRDG